MDHSKDRLDELLSQALSKKMDDDHIAVPDLHQSWESFERKMKVRRKPPFVMKQIGWVAVITLILFTISVIYEATPVFSNIREKIDLYIENLRIGKTASKNPDTSIGRHFIHERELFHIEPEYVTLEEAKNITSFPIRTPKFSADGEYELKQVMIYTNIQRSENHRVRLDYASQHQWFSLVEERISDMPKSLDVQTEVVQLSNVEGSLSIREGIVQLVWSVDEVQYMIYGLLSKEEIIAIAQTLLP